MKHYVSPMEEPYKGAEAPDVKRGFENSLAYQIRERVKIEARYAARLIKATAVSGAGIGITALAALAAKNSNRSAPWKALAGAGAATSLLGLSHIRDRINDATGAKKVELYDLSEFLDEYEHGGYITFYTMGDDAAEDETGATHPRTIYDRIGYIRDAWTCYKEGDKTGAKKALANARHLPPYSNGEIEGTALVYDNNGVGHETIDCSLVPEFPDMIRVVRNSPGVWTFRFTFTDVAHPDILWYGVDVSTPYRELQEIVGTGAFKAPPTPSTLIQFAINGSRFRFEEPVPFQKIQYLRIKRTAKKLIADLMEQVCGSPRMPDRERTIVRNEAESILGTIQRFESEAPIMASYRSESSMLLSHIETLAQNKDFAAMGAELRRALDECTLSIHDEIIAMTLPSPQEAVDPSRSFGYQIITSAKSMEEQRTVCAITQSHPFHKPATILATLPKAKLGMKLLEWSGATYGLDTSTQYASDLVSDLATRHFPDYALLFRKYAPLWKTSEDGQLLYRNLPIEEFLCDAPRVPYDETPCVPSFALTVLYQLVNTPNDGGFGVAVARKMIRSLADSSDGKCEIPFAELDTATRFINIVDALSVDHATRCEDRMKEVYQVLWDDPELSEDTKMELWTKAVQDFNTGNLTRYHLTKIGLHLTTIIPDDAEVASLQVDLMPVTDDPEIRGDDEPFTPAEKDLIDRFPEVTYLGRAIRLNPDRYDYRVVGTADHLTYCGVDLTAAWLELPMKAYEIPEFNPEHILAPNIFSLVCFYVFNGHVDMAYRMVQRVPRVLPDEEQKDIDMLLAIASTLNSEYRERANEKISEIRSAADFGDYENAMSMFRYERTRGMTIMVPQLPALEAALKNHAHDLNRIGKYIDTDSAGVGMWRRPLLITSVNAEPPLSQYGLGGWTAAIEKSTTIPWIYHPIKMLNGEYHLGYFSMDLTELVHNLVAKGHLRSEKHVMMSVANLHDVIRLLIRGGRVIAARNTWHTITSKHREYFLPIKEVAKIEMMLEDAMRQPYFVSSSAKRLEAAMSVIEQHSDMTPEEAAKLREDYFDDEFDLALTPEDARKATLALNAAIAKKKGPDDDNSVPSSEQ